MSPDHWNSPSMLPPVACPILIRMSFGQIRDVERVAHLTDKDGEMTYRCLLTDRLYHGRFEWTYP